jgi:hypothetical protein
MSIFKRKSQGTLVPIHPDNAKTKDWVVLLEAAAIHADLLDRRDMDEDVLAATAVRLGIKPEPLVALNHFTVPLAMSVSLCLAPHLGDSFLLA